MAPATHRTAAGSPGPRVVVLGSSFGGLTGALELREHLGDRAEITVIDRRDHFTFIPSLIWVPFGIRSAEDVTFPLAPMYERKGIRFVHDRVERVDLEAQTVVAANGEHPYDRLLVATGPKLDFAAIPGIGPEGGHTQSVCNLEHALVAGEAWQRFLEDPGPVVVGTAQGGSCFGASYEFLLNVKHLLGKAGLGDVPVTFVTSEPFLGHFGLGGVGDSEERVQKLFDRLGIRGVANASIREARAGEIELASGEVLPAAYSMIVPPFRGVDAITSSEGLGNAKGFVPITSQYRHPEHEAVFAAGVDVAIAPRSETLVPTGVPKTGYMSERMAKVAARNIAADLGHGSHVDEPLDELGAICILDGGNAGIILKTDRVLGDAEHAHLIQGPHAHWAKLAFERLFLASRRRGKLVA
ncbi:MAG: FAD-dependent oxidoreductase [Thermoleophilia bacterium]